MEQPYDVFITTKVKAGTFSPSNLTYRRVPAGKITELVKSQHNITEVTVYQSAATYGVYKLASSWATKVFDDLANALALAALESAQGRESEVRIED